MEAPSQTTAWNDRKIYLNEGSFQIFYRYITIELLCTNNLKFWLACQAVFSIVTSCASRKLYRVIYNDFLQHGAPYEMPIKLSTVEKIKFYLEKPAELDPRSFLSMEKLFKSAQMDINGLQQFGSVDLYCFFDLSLGASIQYQSSTKATVHSTSTNGATKGRPCRMFSLSRGLVSNFGIPNKTAEDDFHQEVCRCLLRVQEERRCMVKKAQQEALLAGKLDINNLEWYDFSEYQTKHQH